MSLRVAIPLCLVLVTGCRSHGPSAIGGPLHLDLGPPAHRDMGGVQFGADMAVDDIGPAGCPDGQQDCGNGCQDVSADPANCGACGLACGPGQDCQGGQCSGGGQCPNGQQDCGNGCTSLDGDPGNCGGCGQACAPGEVCQGGACNGGNMGGGMTGCSGLVDCLNGCQPGDQGCQQQCVDAGTAQAQQLLQAALDCLEMACPSTGGGVCDQNSPKFKQYRCDGCYNDAQDPNGPCGQEVADCLADM